MGKDRSSKGFTMVELLITLVIIGILAGLMLLVTGSGSDRAKATVIVGDIVGLKKATMVYFSENGAMPETIEQIIPYVDKEGLSGPSGVTYGISDQEDMRCIYVDLESAENGVRERLAMVSGGGDLFSDAGCSSPYNGENVVYSPFSKTIPPFLLLKKSSQIRLL